jgi:hypothetical protein
MVPSLPSEQQRGVFFYLLCKRWRVCLRGKSCASRIWMERRQKNLRSAFASIAAAVARSLLARSSLLVASHVRKAMNSCAAFMMNGTSGLQVYQRGIVGIQDCCKRHPYSTQWLRIRTMLYRAKHARTETMVWSSSS